MLDFDLYWSHEARSLRPPGLAGLVAQFQGQRDVVTLHVGLPPPSTFPLRCLSATTIDGESHELCGNGAMTAAQQYCFLKGHGPLLDWLRLLTDACHKPLVPTDIVLTNGAVHAISCLISSLTDRGDFLLVDEYTYAHALECIFIPKGLKVIPVHMDEGGMDPSHLESQVKTAGLSVNGRPPRLVYAIPTGHNPTGITMSTERKLAILEVCQRHNLLLLEDDAYWGLQFNTLAAGGDARSGGERTHTGSKPCSEGDPEGAGTTLWTHADSSKGKAPYLHAVEGSKASLSRRPGLQLPPSFLSLDCDGRVIRIDTFAKLLGPGYRLGWVTAQPSLVDRLAIAVQASSVGPNTMSQVIITQLLQQLPVPVGLPEDSGDLARFEGFLTGLQDMYGARASVASLAAREHLEGLAEWSVPQAGMFMWFKLNGPHADFNDSVVQQLVQKGVAVVPGSLFWADEEAVQGSKPCPYFRLTFGSHSDTDIREGFKRLGQALRGGSA